MAGQHTAGGIGVARYDALDRRAQEGPLFEGEGIALAQVFNRPTQISQIELCFDALGPLDVDRA